MLTLPQAARFWQPRSAARMSTLAWAIAGAVSAFTAILVLPTRGFANAQFLGPGLLLLPGLAAAEAGPASVLAWLALLGLSGLFAAIFSAFGRTSPSIPSIMSRTSLRLISTIFRSRHFGRT